MGSDEDKRRYWSIRFIKAMRPIMTRGGKIRRRFYRKRTRIEVKPINDILNEVKK